MNTILGVMLLILSAGSAWFLLLVGKRLKWEKSMYARARELSTMLPGYIADVAQGIHHALSDERRINLKIFFWTIGWIFIISSTVYGVLLLIPK